MTTKPILRRKALYWLGAGATMSALVLSGRSCVAAIEEKWITMDTSHWKTIYFGRHMITIPEEGIYGINSELDETLLERVMDTGIARQYLEIDSRIKSITHPTDPSDRLEFDGAKLLDSLHFIKGGGFIIYQDKTDLISLASLKAGHFMNVEIYL